MSWFAASNDCLSRGGSLAVFTDIGRPSDNSQLTSWLTSSGTDKTYWIGLVRSWWKTTDNGNLFRPPGTVVPGRPYVLQRFFFFFLSRDLRGPWAELREILPHSRKHVQFTNAGPKIWEPAPSQKKEMGGAKTR